MNYLTALLAFSAIMIVLSTLATVLVEALQKAFNQRGKDFEELLRQLYVKTVQPRIAGITAHAGESAAEGARAFAAQIRENPAFAGAGKLGLLGTKTAFEELTTRQFVEQLAQSDAGKTLQKEVGARGDEVLGDTLASLAYEFERYGQAASGYFQRRATLLSVLVAFVLAVTLNIDALKVYGSLAKNTDMAEQVIAAIDVEQLEKARSPGNDAVLEEYLNLVEQSVAATSEQLEGLGLPIGHDFYPYCDKGMSKDARCPRNLKDWHDFAVWIFRIILTTGLIGLGAPFWYKAYRFLGQFIPGRKPPVSESTGERQEDKSRALSGLSSHDLVTIFKRIRPPGPARAQSSPGLNG